jgi:four helix bundle protein
VLSKIEWFEDLSAWQEAREPTRAIYQVTQQGTFARDLGLARQIQRVAVPTVSNIAEGFERRGRRELRRFLSTAKGSCSEVRSQLSLTFAIGYVVTSDFQRLLAQAEEVGRVVGGLRAAVEKLKDGRRGSP